MGAQEAVPLPKLPPMIFTLRMLSDWNYFETHPSAMQI